MFSQKTIEAVSYDLSISYSLFFSYLPAETRRKARKKVPCPLRVLSFCLRKASNLKSCPFFGVLLTVAGNVIGLTEKTSRPVFIPYGLYLCWLFLGTARSFYICPSEHLQHQICPIEWRHRLDFRAPLEDHR